MNLIHRVSHYISRYAPSEKKLTEYISKKKPTLDIPKFLWELGYDETLMVDMWISTFLALGIGLWDMKMKLYKKRFPKILIESKLIENSSRIEDWSTHEQSIWGKIDDLLKKWKSIQIIQILLVGKYPYFRDNIKELLLWKSDLLWLEKDIEKYMKKYNISDPSERQKLYLALQRKWFSYSDIKDALRWGHEH